jgi:hypothetical protein
VTPMSPRVLIRVASVIVVLIAAAYITYLTVR